MSETLHIYTRVSTQAQEDFGSSLETQRELGEKAAKSLGMIPKVWNEGSGSSKHDDFSNRPVLSQLLSAVDAGQVKQIWVFNTDRLARNQSAWGLIRLKLLAQAVTLRTNSGEFDMSDPTDKLMLGILSEISSYDNALRAERSRLGKETRIRQGYWMGGPPPYGYKVEGKKLVADKFEAKWVNYIFQSYLDGKTINEIRTHLLENQVATRRGMKIWSLGSIEALLTNTHYCGSYTVRSIQCNCDSIIPERLFRAVAEEKKRRAERRVRESSQKYFYLLRDFLTCGHCGCRFGARTNKNIGRAVYYCPRKERNYVNKGTDKVKLCSNSRYLKITETDELVWETVLNVLLKSPLFKSETKEDIYSQKRSEEQYSQEASRLKKQLGQIEREIREHGETRSRVETDKLLNSKTPEQVADILTTIEHQLVILKAKREALIAKIDTHESEQDWDDWIYKHDALLDHLVDLEPENQQVVLKHVVKSITVESIDTQTHRLTINFKLPYYGGRFEHINPKKPSKGHTIADGKDLIQVTFHMLKKTSRNAIPAANSMLQGIYSVTVE